MDVVEEMEDDQIIKLEFEDDETEDMGSAQALVTLHDSVQNMPRKHKSALQVRGTKLHLLELKNVDT